MVPTGFKNQPWTNIGLSTVVTSIFYIQFMLTTNHSDWFQIFLCSKARVQEKSTPAAADSHQSEEM